MELGLARQDEYEQVDALVAGSDLPLDDIELCRAAQYVVRDGDEVVATAALEIRGRDAILRSVAVASGRRGERLGERIVVRTADGADAWFQPSISQPLCVFNRQVLAAAVTVMDKAISRSPFIKRLLQSIQNQ